MRVVHVSTLESRGGAARAAHGLHAGLVDAGVDSRMLVAHRQSDDPRVEVLEPDPADERLWRTIEAHWIRGNRTPLSNTWFSSGGLGARVARHRLIEDADIIHLHWIAGLVAIEDLEAILALGKPVVWTFHDEWGYTGGCHYAAGCGGWRTACDACPQLARDPHGLVAWQFSAKRAAYARGRIAVVTPSAWLSARVRESALLAHCTVDTVPYSVDLEVFAPSRRESGRARLGLSPDDAVVLFSADGAAERRKGFAELAEALGMITAPRPRLLVLGDSRGVRLPEGADCVGHLADRVALAEVVAASDIYALPSLEDNLPNGILEALACGTTCVAFDAGGVPDMLRDAPCGYLAKTGSVNALARALSAALGELARLRSDRAALRAYAESRYSPDLQAERLLQIYRRELDRRRGSNP
jgi:glycosyltransferase involved in cell wall biosynthesis